MSGTCVIADARSGPDEESGAQDPSVLRNVGKRRRAIGARDGEVDARTPARHRNADAKAVVRLVHLLPRRLERKDALAIAESHRNLLSEEARRANLRAYAIIPSVHSLSLIHIS